MRFPVSHGLVSALIVAWIAIFAALATPSWADDGAAETPLRIVVMDPLCKQLACDCVAGYADREYEGLRKRLEAQLERPVHLAFAETLLLPPYCSQQVDVIIGKFSEAASDAHVLEWDVRPLAMLADTEGHMTQHGLFVVRHDDPARSLADLQDRRLLLGPAASDEKHAAALAALEAFDVTLPQSPATSESCNSAALAVVEGDADAAVISSYAMPLLEGCGTIDRGALRVVGRTDRVPMIGVLATARVDQATERQVVETLTSATEDPALCTALKIKRFLPLPSTQAPGAVAWNDWRGPRRDAHSGDVPARLPQTPQLLWQHTLTGHGLAGLAVVAGRVVVADKDLHQQQDIFRCLDADTGRQLWNLAYPAAGEMDFTNAPRANPVVHDGLVYLLGAFGHLHCVELQTGKVVWRRNLLDDFQAKLPTWGTCGAPLVVDDKLIVNPGAADASLAALDRKTGRTIWTTPGDPPGYSCFVLAELGGVRQIVGYDAVSLGGWDPQTGRRLWRLVPEWDGDFNVPTPLVVDGQLIVATENNGARRYGFDDRGRIVPEPLAVNEDYAPDTATPVVHKGLLLGNAGSLWCLDARSLETLWDTDEHDLLDYCSLIVGNGRALITTQSGKLHLLRMDRTQLKLIDTLALFDNVAAADRDVWSHPALIGNRLYVRNLLGVYCFLLE